MTEARRRDGIMLRSLRKIYAITGIAPFREGSGGEIYSPPGFGTGYFFSQTPQNFGQISEDADRPSSFGE